MKTDCLSEKTAKASSNNEPTKLNHQNACGTTTCFFFSVAYHCTMNREVKVRLPIQPMIFQAPHSMPKSLPSCQTKFVMKSIRKLSRSRAALKSTKFQVGRGAFGFWNFSGAWTLDAWSFISPASAAGHDFYDFQFVARLQPPPRKFRRRLEPGDKLEIVKIVAGG